MKAFGYGGSDIFYQVAGLKSTSRFSSSQTPRFIFRLNEDVDPMDKVMIVAGEVKTERRFLVKKTGGIGTVGSQPAISEIPITFKKIGSRVYEVVFSQPLAPGEYAFFWKFGGDIVGTATGRLSCFGID